MTGAQIFQEFCNLFPDYAVTANGYEKIGSKAIKLSYNGGLHHLIFMYKGDDDWTFGTRVWRKKPVKKA